MLIIVVAGSSLVLQPAAEAEAHEVRRGGADGGALRKRSLGSGRARAARRIGGRGGAPGTAAVLPARLRQQQQQQQQQQQHGAAAAAAAPRLLRRHASAHGAATAAAATSDNSQEGVF